jgi:hypothetical protein
MSQPTQHEIDRQKLRYERRHFDRMSNGQVIRAMIWRNRCPLLVFTNLSTVAIAIVIVF